jgi:hypothetical protein
VAVHGCNLERGGAVLLRENVSEAGREMDGKEELEIGNERESERDKQIRLLLRYRKAERESGASDEEEGG